MGRNALMVQGAFGLLMLLFALSRVAVAHLSRCCSSRRSRSIILTSTLVSLAQLIAPDEMRGRVMSIFMVAFRGGMPLGSLAAGTIASVASAPVVLMGAGVLLMALSVWFLTQSHGLKEL